MSNVEICWAVGTFFRISSKVNGWPTGELESKGQSAEIYQGFFVYRFQFNYRRQDYKFTTYNIRTSSVSIYKMVSLTRVPGSKTFYYGSESSNLTFRMMETEPILEGYMATHQWDTTSRGYRTLRPDGFKSR
jgi:hypothetical protein